ncbi:unnamed protein product [Symbiodinium natans]|uniref:Uncharacterized protein n=1 Tax=Symbiodinium natans TaxID=878477 RepID=A0A812UIC0_9DINO|nr:unnamed protein product [Symbiodinium natans]
MAVAMRQEVRRSQLQPNATGDLEAIFKVAGTTVTGFTRKTFELLDKHQAEVHVEDVCVSAVPEDASTPMYGFRPIYGSIQRAQMVPNFLLQGLLRAAGLQDLEDLNVVEVKMRPTCMVHGRLAGKPGEYLKNCRILVEPFAVWSCTAAVTISQEGGPHNVGTFESPVAMVSLSATVNIACKFQSMQTTVVFDFYADGRIETRDLS